MEFPTEALTEIMSFIVGALLGWITKHFMPKSTKNESKR